MIIEGPQQRFLKNLGVMNRGEDSVDAVETPNPL
jgi:hypothetical protein